jgi:hypothetical protein
VFFVLVKQGKTMLDSTEVVQLLEKRVKALQRIYNRTVRLTGDMIDSSESLDRAELELLSAMIDLARAKQ